MNICIQVPDEYFEGFEEKNFWPRERLVARRFALVAAGWFLCTCIGFMFAGTEGIQQSVRAAFHGAVGPMAFFGCLIFVLALIAHDNPVRKEAIKEQVKAISLIKERIRRGYGLGGSFPIISCCEDGEDYYRLVIVANGLELHLEEVPKHEMQYKSRDQTTAPRMGDRIFFGETIVTVNMRERTCLLQFAYPFISTGR